MSNLGNAGAVTETQARERQRSGKSMGKAWGVFLGTALFLLALQPWAAGDPLDNVADGVLGEPDFAHSSLNTLAEDSMAYPSAVAIDISRSPNAVYVADTSNSRVLVWLDATAFSNGDTANLVIGQPDLLSAGCNSSGVSASSLCRPYGVAVDGAGCLYVADSSNNRVLEYDDPIGTDQVADLVFGQDGSFTSNAYNLGGTSASSLHGPRGVTTDSAGNLYVADSSNSRVLEYDDPIGTDQVADRVFGQDGSFTSKAHNLGGISASSLYRPWGVAADTPGNLYVADRNNDRVLEYDDPIGTDQVADRVFGQGGSFTSRKCNLGGVSASSLCDPWGVATDSAGNLHVADRSNDRVLEYDDPIGTDQVADRVFGQGGSFTSSTPNLWGVSALSLHGPRGVATDSAGNLCVADGSNNRVLWYDDPIGTDQVADRVLGQEDFTHNSPNTVDARGLNMPRAVAIDTSREPSPLYVADDYNNRVLVWPNAAGFSNGDSADLVIGQPDFSSYACNQGGVSASSLCRPSGVAVDSAGNLYVADWYNYRVLEYDDPIETDQVADRVFGQDGDFTSNECNLGGISASSLCRPSGVAVDSAGILYVADYGNYRVLQYNDPIATDQVADRVFGQNGDFASADCNLGGISASSLCDPSGVAVDRAGNLYVADASYFGDSNSRVLEYDEPIGTDQVADRVFGQGGSFTSSECHLDGISASSLCDPSGVAVDSAGILYVADGYYDSRVLEYDKPIETDQVADQVFGQGGDFTSTECNLGGITASSLCRPEGVAVDGAGNLYVADSNNHRVLRFDSPIRTPYCGDSSLQSEPGEECDDGNFVSGDGCDWTCRLEFCAALTPPAPPLPDLPYIKCQEAIALAGVKYGVARLKAVQNCLDRITNGKLSGDADELCRGTLGGRTPILPTDSSTAKKISKAEARARRLIGTRCKDADAAALSSCGSSVSALRDCIVASHWRLAEILDRAEYMAPALRDAASAKCQKAIGKAGFVYVKKLLKALRNCVNSVNDRTLPPSTDCLGSFDGSVYTPPGDAKTAGAIATVEARARELIQRRCGDAEIAGLNILDDATTVTEAETRLVCQHRNRVMNMITKQYGPQP